MSDYEKLLRSPEWRWRRAKVLERDKFSCVKCGSNSRLEVHHRYYVAGRNPWDYPDVCFRTLCRECHQFEHEHEGHFAWERLLARAFESPSTWLDS